MSLVPLQVSQKRRPATKGHSRSGAKRWSFAIPGAQSSAFPFNSATMRYLCVGIFKSAYMVKGFVAFHERLSESKLKFMLPTAKWDTLDDSVEAAINAVAECNNMQEWGVRPCEQWEGAHCARRAASAAALTSASTSASASTIQLRQGHLAVGRRDGRMTKQMQSSDEADAEFTTQLTEEISQRRRRPVLAYRRQSRHVTFRKHANKRRLPTASSSAVVIGSSISSCIIMEGTVSSTMGDNFEPVCA